MRTTLLLALVSAAVFTAAAAACGSPAQVCDVKTCPTGCCNAGGVCMSGDAVSACGAAGGACADCSLSAQVCTQQACVAAPLDAGVDAGTFACPRTPLDCSDQTIAQLDLKTVPSTGTVANAAAGAEFTATINATAGGLTPTESYVYVRFTPTGLEKVALDDLAALDSMDWDVGFRRFIIRLNSGDSGPSCVGAQAASVGWDALTAVPAGFLPEGDDFLTKAPQCTFVDDGSGLGTSPRTALSGYYQYSGCVGMTGKVWVLQTHQGRHVKLQVTTYYATTAAQQMCDASGSSGGAAGGTIRLKWAWLD